MGFFKKENSHINFKYVSKKFSDDLSFKALASQSPTCETFKDYIKNITFEKNKKTRKFTPL